MKFLLPVSFPIALAILASADVAGMSLKPLKSPKQGKQLCNTNAVVLPQIKGLKSVELQEQNELCRFTQGKTVFSIKHFPKVEQLDASLDYLLDELRKGPFKGIDFEGGYLEADKGDMDGKPTKGVMLLSKEHNIVYFLILVLTQEQSFIITCEGPAGQSQTILALFDKMSARIKFPKAKPMLQPDSDPVTATAAEQPPGTASLSIPAAGVISGLPKGFVAEAMGTSSAGGVQIARHPGLPGAILSVSAMPKTMALRELQRQTLLAVKSGGASASAKTATVAGNKAVGYQANNAPNPQGGSPQYQEVLMFENGNAVIILTIVGPQKDRKRLRGWFAKFQRATRVSRPNINTSAMLRGTYCLSSSTFTEKWEFDGRGGMEQYTETHGHNDYSGSIYQGGGGSVSGRYQIAGTSVSVRVDGKAYQCQIAGGDIHCGGLVYSRDSCD